MNAPTSDESIFTEAAELFGERREAYLDDACGKDAERRRSIEALLHELDHPDSVFDRTELHVPAARGSTPRVPHILGDFEIVRELGRGGMGVVYESRQKSLKRKVALKVLSSGLGLSSKAILRFRREAEAAGKLHHTNIVPIYTTGEDKGIHYYAMELIDGPSLDAVIKDLKQEVTEETEIVEGTEKGEPAEGVPSWLRKKALHDDSGTAQSCSGVSSVSASSTVAQGSKYFDQVATMIAEVADALEHAHEHGVIHRDIKPSNLLLAPDGRLSINDFGLARMLEQPGMTMTGEFVGSPLYMSPEQITAGRAPLDHRSDIYSLGATLYELLTLQPPFPGESRDQVIGKILHKDAVSPRKLNRRVPVDLETICMKAIERDPDRRYQTAGQMAADLRAYVNRHAISAKRLGPLERTARWINRNRLATTFIAFVIAVVCFGGYFGWQYSKQERLRAIDEINGQLNDAFMSGNTEANQEDLIEQLKDLHAPEDRIRFAQGLLELTRSSPDYEKASVHFERVVQLNSRNIAAQAMLAHSIGLAGDESESVLMLQAIPEEEADTFEEKLFLGFASQWGRPELAYRLLSEAIAEDNEPFVRFQLGVAGRLLAVMVKDEYEEAGQLLDQAHEETIASMKFMTPTPTILGSQLFIGIDKISIHESLAKVGADATKRSEHLRRASEQKSSVLAQINELLNENNAPPKDLCYGIMHALKQLGQHEQLIALADRWARMNHDIGVYASQDLALYLTSQKEYQRANDWYNAARGGQAKKTLFLKTFMQLANPSRTASMPELLAEAQANFNEKLASEDKAFLGFDAILLYLLGDKDQVQQMGEDPMFAIGAIGAFYPVPDYFSLESRDQADRDELLQRCRRGGSPNMLLMHANFKLGVEALAENRFDDAKRYLTACIEGRQYQIYVYKLSRILLAHEKDWPNWIQELQAKSDAAR